MRFPIYLTLILGVLSLITTQGMHDPLPAKKADNDKSPWQRIKGVSRITLNAGKWIMHTPMALAIILFGMSLDHVLRMLVTLNSQYYRTIALPEASFGLIGSAVALIGLIVPRIARAMSEHFTIMTNVTVVVVLAFISLWGITLLVPYYGMLPMILVFITMMLTSFFTSTYLNQIAKPEQRATILSYKGLAFNAAYGIIGVLYGGLIVSLRGGLQSVPDSFSLSLAYFPWYLAIVLILVSAFCFLHFRSSRK